MKHDSANWTRFICRFLALWLSVPIAVVAVGLLPIDDGLRDTFLPLILLELVWPLSGNRIADLDCALIKCTPFRPKRDLAFDTGVNSRAFLFNRLGFRRAN